MNGDPQRSAGSDSAGAPSPAPVVSPARALVRALASGRLPFGVAALAFAAAAARVLTADVDRLLQFVPDDTFYYLQIARNLVLTGESTFDGASPTNGYHPLWMAVLSGLAAIVEDRVALLRVGLGVSLAIHVVVALGLFHVVRRLVDAPWGWTAAACWLINPLAFSIAIQGTEAGISALAALIVLVAHLRLVAEYRAGRRPSLRRAAQYGAALGLLCLARTDGAIIGALSLSWLAGQTWLAYGLRAAATPVCVAGAVAAAVLTPWWLFSLSQVGTIVQDSGAMKMLWAADRYPTLVGRLDNVAITFNYFTRRCVSLMTVWHYSWASFAAACAVLGVAPAVVLARQAGSVQARALRAVLVSALALTLAYGFVFVERQVWWLVLPCLATLLVMFTSFPLLLRSLASGPGIERGARVAIVVLAIALLARWHVKGYRPYPWQPDVRRSQLAIAALVPASEPVGVFNAGIPAYFGSRRVIAVDGLVSHDARRSWESRTFDAFLVRHGIRYIADEQRVMAKALRFTAGPVHLEELAAFRLTGWPTGRRFLWRVSVPAGR